MHRGGHHAPLPPNPESLEILGPNPESLEFLRPNPESSEIKKISTEFRIKRVFFHNVRVLTFRTQVLHMSVSISSKMGLISVNIRY